MQSWIDKSIKSNTVKNWIKENNHKFSNEEQLSLIWNSEQSLDVKRNLLMELIGRADEADESTDSMEYVKSQALLIIDNINWINRALRGEYSRALIFDVADKDDSEESERRVVGNLNYLVGYINKTGRELYNHTIEIVSLRTSNIIAYVTLNSELNASSFYIEASYSSRKNSKLQDYYVDIPIEFKVGDIVRIDGLSERYVVCYDSLIPEQLKSKCDFFDNAVTVVPERVLDENIGYTEQLNAIIKNRIGGFYTDDIELDIISKYHEHITVTLVDRVE